MSCLYASVSFHFHLKSVVDQIFDLIVITFSMSSSQVQIQDNQFCVVFYPFRLYLSLPQSTVVPTLKIGSFTLILFFYHQLRCLLVNQPSSGDAYKNRLHKKINVIIIIIIIFVLSSADRV
jgi:hypothetical protein